MADGHHLTGARPTGNGVFSQWQPRYAAIGLPTFPFIVTDERKRPLVRGYSRIGLPASRQLVMKGLDGDGLACMAGARNKLTVIDIDARGSEGERLLADAQRDYGASRIIVRTGSGGFHAYYRHNGEGRRIRPDPRKPVDLLGAGVVVLPPSRGASRLYEIIHGNLDDLAALTPIRRVTAPPIPPESSLAAGVGVGCRNKVLFSICMKQAHHCDDLVSLLDVARTENAAMIPPMTDTEVVTIAKSAWGYTERGENRIGPRGAWMPEADVSTLVREPALFALIGWLRNANGPNAQFWVADGLCEPKYLHWPIGLLRKTRRQAIDAGWIVKIRSEAKGVAALYRWGPTATVSR